MSLNLGELRGFTKDWGPKMVSDTFFNQHVLLKSMESVRQTYPGGDFIRLPLNVRGDRNDQTGRALGYTESFDFPKLEVGDVARFEPKMEVQVVVIWDYEVAKNGASDVQYADLVQNRISWYMKLMADRKSRYLYGRGGNTTRPNGLIDVFDNTAKFGQIDRTKAPTYRSFHKTASSPRGISRALLTESLIDVWDGAKKPDIGITTPGIWAKIHSILMRDERYPNTALAAAGFTNITFMGVPIVFDKERPVKSATQHSLDWLNFDHLRDYACEGFNMRRHPWARMPQNTGQYEVIVNFGNFCSDNLRYECRLDDLDPSVLTAAA
ncbi:MAG: phage major capsid protein [Candidatus Poribacteria bacterium]|nr:phage major capsid protein [Candidatus Poribacteria bacterium]